MMANKKITQLGLATGVTGPDVLPIVNGGATKRVTLTTLSTFFTASAPTGPTGPPAPTGAIVSNTAGITGADAITNIVSLTQAEYNAVTGPSSSTLYVITD